MCIRDSLGSVRVVYDQNNNAVGSYDYYPFGLVMPSSVTEETKEGFTGREQDEETGLYYFGARYYDAALGRWSAVDPAGQLATPYGYATDPLLYVDPDGESYILAAVVIGAYMGARNASINGENLAIGALKEGAIGALTAAIAGAVRGVVSGAVGKFGAGMGAISGAVGGFVEGFGNSNLNGESLGTSLRNGGRSALL